MSAPSVSAVAEITRAFEDNSPNTMTVAQLMAETLLSETTVRTAVKQLAADGKVYGNKVGNKTTYRLVPDLAPPAPVQPVFPDPPTGRKTAVPKAKNDNRVAKAGARRKEAEERDAQVLAFLTDHPSGYHRKDLSEAMSLDYDLLYISLWRLNKAGTIGKYRDGTRSPVWKIKTEEEAAK
jgi:hypothetical protein